MNDHEFSQATRQGGAEAVAEFVVSGHATDPAGVQMGVEAVANRKTTDALAQCH